MAAQAPANNPAQPMGLYIRTGAGILGPYTLESLRDMAQRGVLPPGGAVSSDGKSWSRADKVLGLAGAESAPAIAKKATRARKSWKTGLQTTDTLRALLQKVADRAWIRYIVSTPVVLLVAVALLAIDAFAVYKVMGLESMLTARRLVMSLAVGVPALLVLLAAGVALGNAVLRSMLGLTDVERRFLALHLPRRISERLHWGRFLRNWIYRGEWLFAPNEESPRAYIHLFRVGGPLRSTEDEVGLWERLGRSLPYGLRELCHPGEAIRQVQEVPSLPGWASTLQDATDGYALGVILDSNYVDWAQGFLARARRRLGVRNRKALDFALAYIEPTAESKVLAVCVYPHARSPLSDLEVSSKELASGNESAAA